MNSLIFKTVANAMAWVLHLVAIWLLFRGHSHPGGGFIAGLISGAAFVIQGLAYGVKKIPNIILNQALPLAGVGLFLSAFSGVLGLLAGENFLTGIWVDIPLGFTHWSVGTPVVFDWGVFLVVLSVISVTIISLIRVEEEA